MTSGWGWERVCQERILACFLLSFFFLFFFLVFFLSRSSEARRRWPSAPCAWALAEGERSQARRTWK
uniref:Uncharacterized protein n=1 Tax=Anguilla anguilla TaxID=7936 RepID=A0A0E9QJT6_ANGAN